MRGMLSRCLGGDEKGEKRLIDANLRSLIIAESSVDPREWATKAE